MVKTKHYCDRCGSEIKYFFIRDHFPYMKLQQNVFEAVSDGDETGVCITRTTDSKNYELCHKCKKDFRIFMNI